MGCGVVAGICLATTWWHPEFDRPLWLAGAVLVVLRLIANMLDGMVAVGRGIATPLGELFNEVPDRVSDTAVLVGAGIAAGGDWGLGLAAALAAMSTAYVRAVGKAAGAPSDFRGPMAKQQRMAVVVLLAAINELPLPPESIVLIDQWTLALVGALSLLTACRRLLSVVHALRPAKTG